MAFFDFFQHPANIGVHHVPVRVQLNVLTRSSLFLSWSVSRSRDLFITNYYDPFQADLYFYNFRPSVHYAPDYTPVWTLSHMIEAFNKDGLRAALGGAWHAVMGSAHHWQGIAWKNYGGVSTAGDFNWPPS